MSKVDCRCGEQMSDVAYPSECKAYYLSDVDFDDVCDKSRFGGSIDVMLLLDVMTHVWVCSNCGRLAFERKADRHLMWYAPEGEA
jgi:hypothetical protein